VKGLVFTYLMTYGGAITSLVKPFGGLLIYVCFAIIKPDRLWFYAVPEGNYSRIVALAMLVGWLAKGLGSWRFGKARGVVLSLIALQVWCVVGAASLASDPAPAWQFVESLLKIVLPFLVGITTIDSLHKVKQLAWVIVLSEGYLALEFNLWYLGGNNRLRWEGFGGMDNNCNAIALVACTGLAFFLGLGAKAWWQKALAFGVALMMLHAILLSNSRGGMLSLIVTAIAIFVLMPKRPLPCLFLALAVAGGLQLSGPEVRARFSTAFADKEQRDGSAESRLVLWSACWDSMQHNPLGVGPANWGAVVPRYGFERGKLAHTLWLQVGAELGLPGLTLLASFYAICIARLLRFARKETESGDPDMRWLACSVIAALIGFAVSAQFVSLDLLEHPYYINLIGACLLKLNLAGRDSSVETDTLAESPVAA
jgi:probable O-glycosylation ligase (exosortase A-associated)